MVGPTRTPKAYEKHAWIIFLILSSFLMLYAIDSVRVGGPPDASYFGPGMTWKDVLATRPWRELLTDYSGAKRGASLDPRRAQLEAQRFLQDLDFVYPGAFAQATRADGRVLAHLEHWPSNPLTQGSFTCYLPGQFTTIAGNEGKPIDNLFFAGEHTNSFYEWQGFMEGAALSGIAAADAIRLRARVRA